MRLRYRRLVDSEYNETNPHLAMTALRQRKIKQDRHSLHGPNLILDVKNFGPIAEAKNIEFKPMTVFVGPSNTGKTYLAMLVHAVLQAKAFTRASFAFAADQDSDVPNLYDDERYHQFVESIQPWIRGEYGSPIYRDLDTGYAIPFSHFAPDVQAFLIDAARRLLREYISNVHRTLSAYFDVETPERLERDTQSECVKMRICVIDGGSRVRVSLLDHQISSLFLNDTLRIHLEVEEDGIPPHVLQGAYTLTADYPYALQRFAEASLPNWPVSHYFRAGRTGLLDAYRELAATLINRATVDSRRNEANNPLAVGFATSEFLQSIVRLNAGNVRRRWNWRIAEILESNVLGGKINVRDVAGITHFEFEKDGVVVPLDRASSMATELAPIVLFIRAWVDHGDLLIIDEPEAHLHPEAQQQMAAALAFMVRSGLRVLITTHSHYMVEQLSAFVNASKLDENHPQTRLIPWRCTWRRRHLPQRRRSSGLRFRPIKRGWRNRRIRNPPRRTPRVRST